MQQPSSKKEHFSPTKNSASVLVYVYECVCVLMYMDSFVLKYVSLFWKLSCHNLGLGFLVWVHLKIWRNLFDQILFQDKE